MTALSALSLELQKRRRDLGMVLSPSARYTQVLNRAIDEAPRALWRLDHNTAIVTVAEQRRYVLAALAGLTQPWQVQRVWMHDDETPGADHELGRWHVEDDLGVLTLVLDEEPPAAGRAIRIEYLVAHAALVNPADNCTLDTEWLLAKAMCYLLLEADPAMEDPNLLQADLQRWDAVRTAREKELTQRFRRKATRARTRAW